MKPRVRISTILLVGFLLLIAIPQLSLGDRSDVYYEAKRQEMVATQIDARSVKMAVSVSKISRFWRLCVVHRATNLCQPT